MTENRDYRILLKTVTMAGLKKGWSGFLWMMKIIFPISLCTAILDWSGLLRHLDFLLKPLMGFLSLPPEAALPLISGMLSSVYGGIAAMAVLPFSTAQMTLMAVFILMCHALIPEGIIQGSSGIHPLKATLIRIGAASVTVLLMAPWVGSSTVMPVPAGGLTEVHPAFMEMIRHWAWTTFQLSIKILVIIMQKRHWSTWHGISSGHPFPRNGCSISPKKGRSSIRQKTEKIGRPSTRRSGSRPCARMSRIQESRWFGTMGGTATSAGGRGGKAP